MVTFGLREEGCGQASGAADSALLCLTWCLLAQHLHHGRGSLGLVGSLEMKKGLPSPNPLVALLHF